MRKKNYEDESWNCPYCNHDAFLREPDIFETTEKINIAKFQLKPLYYRFVAIECLNKKCKQIFAEIYILENSREDGYGSREIKHFYPLLPESTAKVFPLYIPHTIRQDYEEACKIINLSPKSSATLARRCLQGIIRDFWRVNTKSKKLNDEIQALESRTDVDQNLIVALHNVRKMGNIGAHMEEDVNLLIDVDPDEAKILIVLIEALLEETYIARENKTQNLLALKLMVDEKELLRQQGVV